MSFAIVMDIGTVLLLSYITRKSKAFHIPTIRECCLSDPKPFHLLAKNLARKPKVRLVFPLVTGSWHWVE